MNVDQASGASKRSGGKAPPAPSGGSSDEPDLFGAPGDDDIVLADPREVNRAIKAENELAKAAERRRRSGEGEHARLMKTVLAKAPRNPRKQIAEFLGDARLISTNGTRRELSDKSRSDYGAILQQCITDLAERKVHIDNLTDLSTKNVITLVRYWGEQGHAEGTIAWRVSILRRFLTMIGRPSAIPKGRVWRQTLRQNGVTAGTIGRSNLPDMPKGWRDLGIDPIPIIKKIAEEEPVVACALAMMYAFGLRVNESVQIQPRLSDKGTYLLVHRGTKGGKLREVPFSTNPERAAYQNEVLTWAKELADKHRKGVLALPYMNLLQMKNRLRYLVRIHGISKDGTLGVTPHGLRHQFGTDLFKELTGLPAPVLEQVPHETYVQNGEKVRWALLEVSRQMGHERPSISGAYLSSVAKVDKVEHARLVDWLARLGANGDAFRVAGVDEAWVVGSAAYGLPLADGAALQVAVRLKTFDASTPQSLQQLSVLLSASLATTVAVNPWTAVARPDEGAEILFG